MAANPSSERGFLLVEVLAALALLAVALLAMSPMFVMAGKQNAAASDMTFATSIAQEKAESLKATHYLALAAGSDSLRLRGVSFDRAWTVQNDTPHPGIKTVTVTVTPTRQKNYGAIRVARVTYYRVP